MVPGLFSIGTMFGKLAVAGISHFVQKRQAMKEAEQEHRHEMERLDRAARLEKELGSIRLEETQAEGEAQVFTAAVQADAAEAAEIQKTWRQELKQASQWVVDFTAATRPGLTWAFTLALFYFVYDAMSVLRDTKPELLIEIAELSAKALIVGAETAFGAWFGGRAAKRLGWEKKG